MGTATIPIPGVGTLIGGFVGGLALGIVRAVALDKIAEWLLDIFYVGE